MWWWVNHKSFKENEGSRRRLWKEIPFPFLETEENCTLDKTTTQLKEFTFHLPCLGQHPSPTINTEMASLWTRQRSSRTCSVLIVASVEEIQIRHSLRGALEDTYLMQNLWTQQWHQERDARSNTYFACGHIILNFIFCVFFPGAFISISKPRQYFLLPWQKHWKSEPIYLVPNKCRNKSRH